MPAEASVRQVKPPALICHIIFRLGVGGLENGLVNLINHLPESEFRHAVVCTTTATEFRERIRRPDVEIVEINKTEGKDIASYGRVWRALRRLRPQIVHTRNLPALDMLAPAWLAGRSRIVHGEHGLDMVELTGENRRYNQLRRASRAIVDRYIAVSRELCEWLREDIGVQDSRLNLIYNGVDVSHFAPGDTRSAVLPAGFAPPDSIVLGTAGRLERVKNQIGLVQAFCRILEMRPELRKRLRLVIVGEGSQSGAIEQALDQAQLRELAWLPGLRNDMPDLYRALDLFVLPSLREGISNTLLEAMACGRACVATRAGGNPEILPEGIAGALVRVEDDDALAEAILRYIDNPDLIRGHGLAARLHVVHNFSLETMVANYGELYRSLLQ